MITRESDYAIRILACMAWASERYISSTELAERTDVPYRFLRKIARRLIQAGLVASIRGRTGGMKLKRPARDISLLEVIDATDPRGARLNVCIGGGRPGVPCRGRRGCRAQRVLTKLQNRLRTGMASVRLDRLADPGHCPAAKT